MSPLVIMSRACSLKNKHGSGRNSDSRLRRKNGGRKKILYNSHQGKLRCRDLCCPIEQPLATHVHLNLN